MKMTLASSALTVAAFSSVGVASALSVSGLRSSSSSSSITSAPVLNRHPQLAFVTTSSASKLHHGRMLLSQSQSSGNNNNNRPRRVSQLFAKMDPYEQQYQAMFRAAQEQQQLQAEQEYQQQQAEQDNYYNSQQQLNLIQEQPISATSGYQDPYEAQYQQYYQSALEQSVVQEEPMMAVEESYETTSSYFTNEPATAGIQNNYLDYLQSLRQEMPSSPMDDAHNEPVMQAQAMETPPPSQPPMEQQSQQQSQSPSDPLSTDVTQDDMEERFLKMVSNEVNYKKFLNQSPYSLSDLRVPVLLQRFLDNLEDGTQKKNGKFAGQSKFLGKKAPREQRKTVVVLGTGWASHAFIKLASTYDLRIVVVSPVNHFVFTPMLASASVGTVEYRSMTEPIRCTNPYIDNFVEGRAIGVDVEGKKVQVRLTDFSTVTGAFKGVASSAPCRLEPEPVESQIIFSDDGSMVMRDPAQGAGGVIELNYDYLICAVGTAARSQIVPGAKQHCFNLKTSQDSKRLRTAIGEALEYASRPDVQEFYYDDEVLQIQAREERRRRVTIAVVGGGPTGVELSGELKDFFKQVCSSPDGAYQRLRDDVSVVLVHGGSELLPAMDKELRQRALEALLEQGVDVRLNTRLSEVGQEYITIKEKGSDIEETIPVGVTVWAAGNAPVPFVKELLSNLPPEAAGSAGRIKVDEWCRCPTPTAESFGSILVLGDVACFETQEKYDEEPVPLPQTAQVAGQQGAFVARMLNRGYDMQKSIPELPELPESDASSLLRLWLVARGLEQAPGFNFLSLGLLAYVGQEEALNQVELGKVPIFNYTGKIAFALWRTVYLTKQASTRNQALIAFDWLRTEQFGRDITRL